MSEPKVPDAFWSVAEDEILKSLAATPQGLTTAEAQQRLAQVGPNSLKPRKHASAFGLFLTQFKSPIVILLIVAATLAAFLGDPTDTAIIFAIVLVSGLLGFIQEHGAADLSAGGHGVRQLFTAEHVPALLHLAARDTEAAEVEAELPALEQPSGHKATAVAGPDTRHMAMQVHNWRGRQRFRRQNRSPEQGGVTGYRPNGGGQRQPGRPLTPFSERPAVAR